MYLAKYSLIYRSYGNDIGTMNKILTNHSGVAKLPIFTAVHFV